MTRAHAVVDLTALAHNVAIVRAAAPASQFLAVVKADAYGHGLVPIAKAAREAGAEWLGVALLEEALELRASGDEEPILAWLWTPGDPSLGPCLTAGVQVSVSAMWSLIEVTELAAELGVMARIHLKIDTGLSRSGADEHEWEELAIAAKALQSRGRINVVGIWSHLANASTANDPTIAKQRERFLAAVRIARSAGLEPQLLHLANSASTLEYPDTQFDLVRIGIAMYGISPMDPQSAQRLGLRAVMSLHAQLAHVKTIPAGQSVSYGGKWTATEPTRVGLVPVGYADGIPRAAEGAFVLVRGLRCAVLGRIAMDQFVIELPPELGVVKAGEAVLIFGDASTGAATADDWGTQSNSIGYEIVTRIGTRIPREYVSTA
ncbi:MAG: alanine racemase [Actinomycetota bacterium]|nr:alanine racemase [Actinomycetota bacterium]